MKKMIVLTAAVLALSAPMAALAMDHGSMDMGHDDHSMMDMGKVAHEEVVDGVALPLRHTAHAVKKMLVPEAHAPFKMRLQRLELRVLRRNHGPLLRKSNCRGGK